MRVIDLALKDLRQLVRDWKAATFLVGMPVVFTLLMGFVFGGFGGEEDPRLPVGVLDRDDESVLSAHLLDLLDTSDVIRPVVLDGESIDHLKKQVEDKEWAAAVVIPTGYGERMLAGETVPLAVIVDEDSTAGSTARSEVQTVVLRLAGAVQAARLSAQAFEAQGREADRAFLEEGLDRAAAAWEDPPLTVSMTQASSASEDDEPFSANAFAHTSPAMMIQFAVAGLIGAGEILVQERRSRALQRLLTTAISPVEIILGHFLAMLVMIFSQLMILVAFGQIVVDVNYLREPLATLLMMGTTALWTAGLGLLIGVVAKTQDQVIIFSMIPMFVLSALGGAWVPLEFTNETFRIIGRFTPSAWAMEGFENIVIRGLGLRSVLAPVGITLAYAVGFFGLAVWRFSVTSNVRALSAIRTAAREHL